MDIGDWRHSFGANVAASCLTNATAIINRLSESQLIQIEKSVE